MSDSDDDMPPPLEDMTDKVDKISQQKQKFKEGLEKAKEEAIKSPVIIPSNETSIPSWDDIKPAPIPKQVEKAAPKAKKKNAGFGGFAAGFLNAPPKKKKTKADPKVEDITYVKAKPKEETKENLKFKEVQDALNDKKDEWWTPDLLSKILKNETLRKAFTSPEYKQCLQLLQTDPKEAVKQYGTNPEFVKIMTEFSSIMGSHWDNIAKEKEKDPIADIINNDEEVKAALMDPKVQKFIQVLQTSGTGIDIHYIMQNDQYLAEKLKLLISKGVLNLSSSA